MSGVKCTICHTKCHTHTNRSSCLSSFSFSSTTLPVKNGVSSRKAYCRMMGPNSRKVMSVVGSNGKPCCVMRMVADGSLSAARSVNAIAPQLESLIWSERERERREIGGHDRLTNGLTSPCHDGGHRERDRGIEHQREVQRVEGRGVAHGLEHEACSQGVADVAAAVRSSGSRAGRGSS